jgi:VCBS repeat-containing protein
LGLGLGLLVFTGQSFAQDPYHGVYFGNLDGCGISSPDSGFAVFVEQKSSSGSQATKLQWGSRQEIFSTRSLANKQPLTLGPDGSFTGFFVDFNAWGNGTFTSTGVTGVLVDTSNDTICGSISGDKQSKIGPLYQAAGLYAGELSGRVLATNGNLFERTTGEVHAIMAPSGRTAIFTTAAGISVSKRDGGTIHASIVPSEKISINGTLFDGTNISGLLELDDLTGGGTFLGHVIWCLSIFGCTALDHFGTWSMSRTLAWANASPTALDDSYLVRRRFLVTSQETGVLGNDDDSDQDSLVALLETAPTHGTLALQPDGSFSYTPERRFIGTDTFSYRASDGIAISDPAFVAITVQRFNLAPILNLLLE